MCMDWCRSASPLAGVPDMESLQEKTRRSLSVVAPHSIFDGKAALVAAIRLSLGGEKRRRQTGVGVSRVLSVALS